jgi:hypothetical protein
MADSARIHDVEALKRARAALADFADQVGAALASVDSDIQRVSQWLNVERPTHWKLEVRRRMESVERGKAEIMRKKIIAAPEPASVVLEERRLERARQRVENAQRRLDSVRRWAPVWEREAMMYKGSSRALTEALHADIPRGLAILSRMMESLEAYAAVAPPSGEIEAPLNIDAMRDPSRGEGTSPLATEPEGRSEAAGESGAATGGSGEKPDHETGSAGEEPRP